MPKHIHVWIGLVVQEVHFVQSKRDDFGQKKFGFAIDKEIDSKNFWKKIFVPDDNYFYLPENSTHPRSLKDKVVSILRNTGEDRFVNFTTHSHTIINILGDLISDGKIDSKAVTIHVLEDDNSAVKYEASFDKEGYLVNWCAGELSY